ncbi:hypothetical protein JMJ77_0005187 [Colletotrichum scovillei]|uniref:Uncharacterized protein n=1 Tax=Colletotrichum scovillei TaxID=1209932 RepID=A0A9P7UHX6_9PEZI|nr:hypothetical protein JMJ77_0005187 [Colletotrichum scovillei]KAG7076402.1 hypothetical protein JMJ76_0013667 [Colletotrichum scovillei]KAG7083566.1 hypothetical protein JMJ78_0009011 [Colletotrichum scovillei]
MDTRLMRKEWNVRDSTLERHNHITARESRVSVSVHSHDTLAILSPVPHCTKRGPSSADCGLAPHFTSPHLRCSGLAGPLWRKEEESVVGCGTVSNGTSLADPVLRRSPPGFGSPGPPEVSSI